MDNTPLSEYERAALAECETAVAARDAGYVAAGRALARINDSRLYRETHSTFERYVEERHAISRAQAYRLIKVVEVHDELAALAAERDVSNLETPRESVLRPLTSMTPEERRPVLRSLAETIGAGGRVTAKDVEAAIGRTPPQEFRTIGEISAEHRCPRCAYEWNGDPRPEPARLEEAAA